MLVAINQSFYQQEPLQDTPYRGLVLEKPIDGDWRVRLTGGKRWGQQHRRALKTRSAKTFEEAKKIYDEVFREIEAEGWHPYVPGPTASL